MFAPWNHGSRQQRIIERGEGFAQQADYARDVIADNAGPFLRDGIDTRAHGLLDRADI
jgi:hypothetical protein